MDKVLCPLWSLGLLYKSSGRQLCHFSVWTADRIMEWKVFRNLEDRPVFENATSSWKGSSRQLNRDAERGEMFTKREQLRKRPLGTLSAA